MSDDTRDDDVSLSTLLDRYRDTLQEELHTALPGRVEAFDAATQTVDVTPMIRRALPTPTGQLRYEAMPTIRAVPVVFPSAGDWFLRFPIAAGDEVLVLCCERDIARWRGTGEQSNPIDVRAHHLAHAIAIPGLRSRPNDLPAPSGTALELGKVGGSTIRVNNDGTVDVAGAFALTLAPRLAAHLSAIAAGMDALSALASGGVPTPQANYGVAAKAALDASNPIAALKARGA